MRRYLRVWITAWAAIVLAATGIVGIGHPQQRSTATPAGAASPQHALVQQYCTGCHNVRTNTGGLALDIVDVADPGASAAVWERVVRKLRAGAMPPAGLPRPDEGAYSAFVSYLENSLDSAAADRPDPGRVETFRRLNRTEYQNAIRDLLALEIDAGSLLPQDDSSHGFDNVTVGELSPTLMERYLAAAQKVSRLAIGSPVRSPASHVVLLPPDLTQEAHFEGLPFGTRGGTLVPYTFPLDGEYEIQIRLARDRNENVEGLTEPHEMELMLDGERVQLITVSPGVLVRDGIYYSDEGLDSGFNFRVPVQAGPHVVSVSFLRKNGALIETERQPYQARFNSTRHPRVQPALYSVSIVGPFDPAGAGDTPSRRRILTCRPADASQEAGCAKTIISTLARRAYRRPVTEADIERLLMFYDVGRREGDFESGLEMAVRALLTSTEFLFRVELDPEGIASNTPYRIGDVELASRLSFFLWSSIPDDELLDAAMSGTLRDPAELEGQVRRMLADERSNALVNNFAAQWLYLRNLAAAVPDGRLFPDFDDNLRQSFRRETELFFQSILREDRSVLELLTANYTFLNERLARHYGIPNVYGSHFRQVTLEPGSVRSGLLGHGSILTLTSYSNRTSPVLRGKWILDNILGTPPPPPPENVPPLGDSTSGGRVLTMRERMAQHRANPACASCHQLMDPVGLSMENFDAIGRWRTRDGAAPVDAMGGLPDGSTFEGVNGLREQLLHRPELFASNLTEKLLTYALGRGIDYYDAPAIRSITREALRNDYRFSSLITGIVKSAPFQMRKSQ